MSTDEYDDPLGFLRDLTGDSTLAMAALGAVVSVFGSFLPVSPLFGGMLAGYLTRESRREGVRVGAISGVIATIPILLFLGLFFGIGTFGLVVDVPRTSAFFLLFALFALGTTLVFTIGLSAAGGWLGVFLFDEYVRDRDTVGRRNGHGDRRSRRQPEGDASGMDDESSVRGPTGGESETEAGVPGDDRGGSGTDDDRR